MTGEAWKPPAGGAAARTPVIGVVGNPNCGKSTLFNALTGARQQVGNWPGVTVERKSGQLRLGHGHHGSHHHGHDHNHWCQVVDLPGIYSLGISSGSSEDERVAREFVLAGEADLIVNIVDAANLERNLYLTTQLLEMRVPLVVVLNMMDIARRRGLVIDTEALARQLGCPVVPVVATHKRGLKQLAETIAQALPQPQAPATLPRYAEPVETAVAALEPVLAAVAPDAPGNRRWLALKLLEGDLGVEPLRQGLLAQEVDQQLRQLETAAGEEADIVIADGRFSFASATAAASVRRPGTASRTLSDLIDRVVLNRVLGIPIFLGMMYLMFMFTINIGGAFIDFFDQSFSALLVDELGAGLSALGAPTWLDVLVAKGIGGGIQTVATFIPVIGALFLFLSALEDSGYMARASFVMDRAMRAVGLPGKSFVPLIVGFGCNVPAIMATRTLEHRRDRILTIMMAPFMSCGARLPVYALFAAAFFPEGGQNVVFALYLIGLTFAIGTGLLLKNTLLQGEASAFVMELPPYHLPTLGTVGRRAWDRLKGFIVRAGRVIVPMVMILSFLNALGTDGSFGNENSEKSVLASAGQSLIPVFEPMGMKEENWPAAVGIFTGIFAKEAVVGTLNALYQQVGGDAPAAEAATPTLLEKLTAALQTIPANLGKLAQKAGDPLGLDVSFIADRSEAAQELKVSDSAITAMVERFDGAAGAFAYLLLILLYMPCVAATGTIRQEVGGAWTLFSAAWTTGLGYSAAVIFYQSATFARDPLHAAEHIVIALTAVATAVVAMWLLGRRRLTAAPPALAD